MSRRVLIIDDDQPLCETLAAALAPRQLEVAWCLRATEALKLLGAQAFDAVLTDLRLEGMQGIELCREVAGRWPDLPVVVGTAFGSLETAVAAIRAGAYDFVTKPFQLEELTLALERAAQHHALTVEVRNLRRAVREARRFEELVGTSGAMEELYELVSRVAETDATVLITGESGTGKELVARALHHRGRRSGGPFVAVNCAALPEALLESELFGHVRGAFTDAREARTGLLVRASGGTLFLDEIGELPLAMQAKLLRALQERSVRPLGGDAETAFDTRIAASSNRDLEAEVAAQRFRADLYYRVNVVRIRVPPLREREGDVLQLAQHFLEQVARRNAKRVTGLSPAVAKRLMEHRWPGNVRELSNCMETAVALAASELVGVDDLPESVRAGPPRELSADSSDAAQLVTLADMERGYILRVLTAVGGNRTQAARVLGVDRRTLHRRLDAYGERVGPGGAAIPPAGDLARGMNGFRG
jgi:two-component system response regulator HydG